MQLVRGKCKSIILIQNRNRFSFPPVNDITWVSLDAMKQKLTVSVPEPRHVGRRSMFLTISKFLSLEICTKIEESEEIFNLCQYSTKLFISFFELN